MTSIAAFIDQFITPKEASCGPCIPPCSAPVSCRGKKPLGIFTMMTALSAITNSRAVSIKAELSRAQRSE